MKKINVAKTSNSHVIAELINNAFRNGAGETTLKCIGVGSLN